MPARHLAAVLSEQAERLGPRPALCFKKYGLYRELSWTEYGAQACCCAAALVEAGMRPGDRVGLVSANCVEWLIADMGILTAAAVNVPPHAPLAARQVSYQLADAEARIVFVANAEQLAKIVETLDELPGLEGIVVFDGAVALAAPKLRVPIRAWGEFLQTGRRALASVAAELDRRAADLTLNDLATIMYTSGTTGVPKGVMLTHGNLLSNAEALHELQPHQPGDLFLSWLPYSHIYARTVDHYRGLVEGATVCLGESAETVVQNLADVQPTHMSSVPRFYEKVLTAVYCDDAAELGKRLRRLFGRRIAWLTSGGAPLPPPVAETYLKAGLLVLQGYGLTETAPVISFNRRDRYKLDSVGQPISGVEVKIAADGEILTRGPHVMKGYWKHPEWTDESIKDGWFHTGDLGHIDQDGFLFITGRKKDLLVLSNGKKVVPPHIEGLLQADECIEQAVVAGEGKNFLTALIVPSWDNLRRVLASEGIDAQRSESTLARCPQVQACLQRRIDGHLKDVSNSEHVRKFVLLERPFSLEAEELTVSLKLRRNVVLKKHAAELDGLYAGE